MGTPAKQEFVAMGGMGGLRNWVTLAGVASPSVRHPMPSSPIPSAFNNGQLLLDQVRGSVMG